MFEKDADEYADNQIGCGDGYYEWTDVTQAYQKGAEFGYNKAKEEMLAQIEKMKCCYNCQKDCGSIDRRICFENQMKDWTIRVVEND